MASWHIGKAKRKGGFPFPDDLKIKKEDWIIAVNSIGLIWQENINPDWEELLESSRKYHPNQAVNYFYNSLAYLDWNKKKEYSNNYVSLSEKGYVNVTLGRITDKRLVQLYKLAQLLNSELYRNNRIITAESVLEKTGIDVEID